MVMTGLYAVAGVGGLCLLVVLALLAADAVVSRRDTGAPSAAPGPRLDHGDDPRVSRAA